MHLFKNEKIQNRPQESNYSIIFNQLPLELLSEICLHLSVVSMLKFARVSKKFLEAASESRVWQRKITIYGLPSEGHETMTFMDLFIKELCKKIPPKNREKYIRFKENDCIGKELKLDDLDHSLLLMVINNKSFFDYIYTNIILPSYLSQSALIKSSIESLSFKLGKNKLSLLQWQVICDQELGLFAAKENARTEILKEQRLLHLAVRFNRKEMVVKLLSTVPLLTNIRDDEQNNVLHCCDDLEIAQCLIAQDPNLLNSMNKKGQTPLHCAVEKRNEAVCALLLSRGAFPNKEDNDGATPLHLACRYGYLTIVQHLLKEKAAMNIAGYHWQGYLNLSPVLTAIISGHLQILCYLLDNGAELPQSADWSGWIMTEFPYSPIEIANSCNHIEIINYLNLRALDRYIKSQLTLLRFGNREAGNNLEVAYSLKAKMTDSEFKDGRASFEDYKHNINDDTLTCIYTTFKKYGFFKIQDKEAISIETANNHRPK